MHPDLQHSPHSFERGTKHSDYARRDSGVVLGHAVACSQMLSPEVVTASAKLAPVPKHRENVSCAVFL